MVLFSSDDELPSDRRSKRRANTISLKTLAGCDEDDAPGFARPTLSLSTKSRKGTKRFDDILSELTDAATSEALDRWHRSPPWGAAEVESHTTNGLDKAGMDELRAMKSSISEVPLFQNCSPKFVEAIAEQVSHRLFTPGVDIMKEGDYGDSMYILHRGTVEVMIGGNTVCTLSDGAVFGEIAALCKNPLLARRTATIRAVSLCDCRVTYRDNLLKVMSRFKVDEDIVLRKLENRIVEKEWWRAPVKQEANLPARRLRPATTLPALGGEKENVPVARPSLNVLAPPEDQRTAANTPVESKSRGDNFPVWALELACRRSDEPTEGLDQKEDEDHGRRVSVPGIPVPGAGRRKRKPRGHSCISSLASMKADAHDRECAENELFEWPQSARLPERSAAPLAPPSLPSPPVPRAPLGVRSARSAPQPATARVPSPWRHRDIRRSR